jgi:predicted nucleotidyltransferase
MTPESLAPRVAALLEAHADHGLVAVYLFGSHAEGRAHRESDLDLGVLLRHADYPTARERFEGGLRLHALLSPAGDGRPLDLVVLNDAPPGLAAAVMTKGSCLVCRDPELDHAFRRDSQLRAADLKPFLLRAAGLKREAIGR